MRDTRQRSRARLEHVERADAIVAWRYWGVHSEAGEVLLQSPFRTTPWPRGAPFVAECLGAQIGPGATRRRHQAPEPNCRCGIYGGTYRSLRSSVDANLVRPSATPVFGRVLLWGDVVSEGASWRATYGYPERLLVPTLLHDAYRIAEALEAYDVPVTIMDVGATYTALHPKTRMPVVPAVAQTVRRPRAHRGSSRGDD